MHDNLALSALVVVVATGTVGGHQQIIYVHTKNGTLDSSCWDSRTVMPGLSVRWSGPAGMEVVLWN